MQKISILIIAHNEEQNIEKCILSILAQSQKPDEIVLIAHNCTDGTAVIAEKYKEVRTVRYEGPIGIPYARIKGFEEVIGDIICCIDGDGWARKEWISSITQPLSNPEISGVGSIVTYTGSLFNLFATFKYFYLKQFSIVGTYGKFCFWGPSFALRKKDYERIGGLLPFIDLRKNLKLTNWPDDSYLSLKLWQLGKVVLVKNKKAKVFAQFKHNTLRGILGRPFEQMGDGIKLYNYFKNEK